MDNQKQIECKRNFKWLKEWCKRNKRTIFICGTIIFVAGFATQRIYHHYRSAMLLETCSFPVDEDEKTMHLSSDTTSTVASNISMPSTASGALVLSKAFITDKDRINLERCFESEKSRPWEWKEVVQAKRESFDYKLMARNPKEGGPTQYLSTTRYKFIEDTNIIKDFITDNNYKKEWDDAFLTIEQLEIDDTTGIEILHIVKKYPKIGTREYVLATKLWEKEDDKSFICVTKAWNNERAPKARHTRVTNYLSGWRISKAREGGCEMKLFHQEDMKSTLVELFRDLFKSRIIEYVEESERRLQIYIQEKRKPKEEKNAATLAQKI